MTSIRRIDTLQKKNILIKRLPGIGKTTLIKKLSEALTYLHPAGFYTSEIREVFNPSIRLIIIDEIDKMECFSEKSKKLLEKILNSEKSIIATITLKVSGPIAEIKRRKDVKIFEITKKNRDSLLLEILKGVEIDH
jgi:nucleoside-triphosphatase THEP1